MRYIINFFKQVKSFFSEIFTTRKGLIILGCIVVSAALFFIFADKELVKSLIHDFTLKNIISLFSLSLIWHVVLIGSALAFIPSLTFILGTCLRDKNHIRNRIENAQLPPSEKVAHPVLQLYIPHRLQGYIEMEFYSPGVTLTRWEDKFEDVEQALDIEIIDIRKTKGNIIIVHAANDTIYPKKDVLYDE